MLILKEPFKSYALKTSKNLLQIKNACVVLPCARKGDATLGKMFKRENYAEQQKPIARMKKGAEIFGEKLDQKVEEFWKSWGFYHKIAVEHGEYEYFWKFDSEEKLKSWMVTVDADNKQGFSKAFLSLSKSNKAMFYGNLSTEIPKEGKLDSTGYCQLRSPYSARLLENSYDWSMFTHLVIRCRGDGRAYLLNIQEKNDFDVHWDDQFIYTLFTRGGPYWQIAKIPLSKFYLTHRGALQDKQIGLNSEEILYFAITLTDDLPGPFHLEIDYIALLRDENHDEDNAYEAYAYDEKLHFV